MTLIVFLTSIIGAIPFPEWISDTALSLGPVQIKWYGLAYVVGAAGAYFYARRVVTTPRLWQTAKTPSGPVTIPNKAMLEDYFFFALLGIMVGGRIGSIVLYNLGDYIENPIEVFKVWKGGMAFHGGLLGVGVAVWYLSRKYKIPLARMADIAAIGAPIGLGLVRLTNFINQELWGSPTNLPWGVIFDGQSQARHPTQIYEALLEGLVLWLIIRLATHKFKALTRPGLATGIFLLGYGTFRIWVELYRLPDYGIEQFGIFQRGQMYSLPMVIGGALIIWWAMKRPPVAPKYMRETKDEAPSKAKIK
ncbi:prolipoprotein diacylglyceryl transferase [Robiginitomaculum antarcticum]|uniref:prolipoprotein diacylglyceryl transferase n=1 Tax=Robiginitomaculum antarcticum TaxID=437507 RepID=UPI00037AC732|nr:prolipoprotein diacylglyceryl transferase [Robiginitomaculum antarcticum]